MFKKKVPEQYRRAYWIYSRAALVAIAVGGSYALIYFYTNISIQSQLTATGIIASALLTFALIAVYRDIGQIQSNQAGEMIEQRKLQEDILDIQREQSQIMEAQKEMLAQEYSPDVQVKEIEHITKNSIICTLENRGSGLAIDIALFVEVKAPIDDPTAHSPYSLGEAICPAKHVNEYNPRSTGVIKTKSKEKFEFHVSLPVSPDDIDGTKSEPFDEAIDVLSENYNVLTIEFSFRYSDSSGNEQEIDYRAQSVQMNPELTLDQMIF